MMYIAPINSFGRTAMTAKRLTLKSINKQIAHMGLELVPGAGYFYFVGDDTEHVHASVYTYRLNNADMSYWVSCAQKVRDDIDAHYSREAQSESDESPFKINVGDAA